METKEKPTPIIHRGKYTWKLNCSGIWAWFGGGRQVTGAYRDYDDADYAFEAHRLKASESAPNPSFSSHPDYPRLDHIYGALTAEQIDGHLAHMHYEMMACRRAAQCEFNGRGGRRTGAAVAAEAARDIGQERLLLSCYREEKFGRPE